MMRTPTFVLGVLALAVVPGLADRAHAQQGQAPVRWKQHEMNRPRPERVEPVPQQLPAPVPADAIVLFGGNDLSRWQKPGGGAADWVVQDGYLQVAPGKGGIQTREGFGDVQLHVEWAMPDPPRGTGQDRGNSGVFLMNQYEVQVLDNFNADTYPDGQAGAIYGQYPPLFNATRAPGEWQAYDIFFRRPRFGPDGSVVEPARMTVVHNGILIQNNEVILGPTSWLKYSEYKPHANELPIALQDHGHPTRFRNIWVRKLPERIQPPADYRGERIMQMSAAQMDRYVGNFTRREGGQGGSLVRIRREGNRLIADLNGGATQQIMPVSPTEFVMEHTGGRLLFDLNAQGSPTGVVFEMGGAQMRGHRER